MNWSVNTPRKGQIVRTKVTFYYHYGIFIDENEVIQFGLPTDVSRPADEIKVISTDIYTFLNGGILESGEPTREEVKSMRNVDETIKIARSRIGEGGYNILSNNCEHFVNQCAFGISTSFLDSVREKIRKKLNK